MNSENETAVQITSLTGKEDKPETQNLFNQLKKQTITGVDKTEPDITSLPDECGDTLWDEVLK